MKKCLVVVDMQNDFVSGSLGSAEACAIVDAIKQKVELWDGDAVYTMDTHDLNYLNSQEGRKLPVIHCIKGSEGWQLIKELSPYLKRKNRYLKEQVFEKDSFGSYRLVEEIVKADKVIGGFEQIELVGLCTDICVISNAMLIKSALPNVKVSVDSKCCAGVSVQSHLNALQAMKMCQIEVY